MADPDWFQDRIAAVRGVPRAADWLRSMQRAEEEPSEEPSRRAQARSFAVTRLTNEQRQGLFQALFPRLASAMECVWQRLPHTTYKLGPCEPDSFRAPRHPKIVEHTRSDWFEGVFSELSGHDPDPAWLATWGAHFGWTGIDESALMLAAVMDEPGQAGDEVFEILKASASNRHEIGVMGDHVIRAMLQTAREEAWSFIGQMLLAAQRQEGLRQSILELVHTAHPGAFRQMLRLIRDEDLVRFAATVRAVDVWFSFGWDSSSAGHARSIIDRVLGMIDDQDARAAAIKGKNVEDAYLALWCEAHADAQAASLRATELLSSAAVEKRWLGVHLLVETALPENRAAVLRALDDDDLRVAARALDAVRACTLDDAFSHQYQGPDAHADAYVSVAARSRAEVFDAVERLMRRIPGRQQSFKPLAFPWNRKRLTTAEVGYALTLCCTPDRGERLIGHLGRLDANSRAQAAWLIARRAPECLTPELTVSPSSLTPTALAALIGLLGDPAKEVRRNAAYLLELCACTPQEAAKHEALLDRAASDIRTRALARLLTLGDDAVLEIARRCLSGTKQRQAAGLEVLRALAEAGRALDAVRALARPIRDSMKKPGKDVQPALDAIFIDRPEAPFGVEDAFGLAPNFTPRPLPTVRERRADPPSRAAAACILALNELVRTNATFEIASAGEGDIGFEGGPACLLGAIDASWRFVPRPGTSLDNDRLRCPVAAILEPWLIDRGPHLRDADGLELLRAWLMMKSGFPGHEGRVGKALERSLKELAPAGHARKLEFPVQVWLMLSWALRLHPPPGGAVLLIDALESAIARGDLVRRKERRYDFEIDHSAPGLSAFACVECFRECPAAYGRSLDGETLERFEGLLRVAKVELLARPEFAKTHDLERDMRDEFSIKLADFIRLWDAGRVGDDELLVRLATGTSRDNKRSVRDFEELMSLRQPGAYRPSDLTLSPRLDAILDRFCRRVLEIELARGDAPTPATPHAIAARPSGGVGAVVPALAALGRLSLVRGAIYRDTSKAGSLSQIIRNSRPGPDDTPEAFARAARQAGLTERRLVELALYQPDWASHVQHAIDWPALEDAVLWLRAHTKDPRNEYRPDDAREAWESRVSELTPIPRESLADGAVDRSWFDRCHKAMGPKRWEVLYEAAKFASTGVGHTRARLFADAMLGKVSEKELTARVAVKRHQDAARALGLLALKPGDTGAKQVLARFQTLDEMRRTSRRHGGSMLQASEKRAVEIGIENLAWTAGYPDPLRLQWAMEIQQFGDLTEGPVTVKVGDVAVALGVDDEGSPSLTAARKGVSLKAIPPAVKKDGKVKALQDRLAGLRRQRSRVRHALELAMCRGDTFTGAELHTLFAHPLLKPLLSRLLMVGSTKVGGGLMGYPTEGGKALRSAAGDLEPVRSSDTLRVAHPLDLHASGRWDLWQRECFAAERVQPFKQVFREIYIPVGPELGEKGNPSPWKSTRYAGQQVQPRQALALFGSRGWVARPEAGVQRTFHRERLTIVVAFAETFYTPAEIDGLTLAGLEFTSAGSRRPVPISTVAPRIFSEVMRDLDLVVSVAHRTGVDPEASQSTAEVRAALLRETCTLLALSNVRVEGPRAIITGSLASYALHLGSGTIHIMPGGTLWVVPVHSQHRGRIFLPFADDDPKTAEILSKALLLARDRDIQDPAILAQIRAR
jgi:hypothetical protein